MKKSAGKAVSVPRGLFLSLAANVTIVIVGSAVIAILLNHKSITWNSTGYWIMSMLILAAFVGAKIAVSSIKTQRHLISLMSGLLFWMFLMCMTALFFGGHYYSFFETGILIISGSLAAALLHNPKTGRNRRKSIPYYR